MGYNKYNVGDIVEGSTVYSALLPPKGILAKDIYFDYEIIEVRVVLEGDNPLIHYVCHSMKYPSSGRYIFPESQLRPTKSWIRNEKLTELGV